MRQVRRKTADPSVRKYLMKAKQEGIKLSWNRYESMLPQDGFARLGLTCSDCLQGPCRLNPFSRKEERTICGKTKDTLVYQGLCRLMTGAGLRLEAQEAVSLQENDQDLFHLAGSLIGKLHAPHTSNSVQGIQKEIGLGVLKRDYVNICLEEVTPNLMQMVRQQAEELKDDAKKNGARGFNLVIAGDITPSFPFASVGNSGGSELAVLTGILDGYIVGPGGLGMGKNAVPHYHTVYAECGYHPSSAKIKEWLVKAAAAYTLRDQSKILCSDEKYAIELHDIDKAKIEQDLGNGTIRGICILGGGSNLKLTQDELICEVVAEMSAKGVLCLVYGNAAVTLGKYHGSLPLVRYIGSEADVIKIMELLESIQIPKRIALFPELTTPKDIVAAFALAGAGVKVLTAVNLPVEGSKTVAEEIERKVSYAPSSEFLHEALQYLEL